MDRLVGLLAVQIQSQHPIGPSRSGLVGILTVTVGLVFVGYGTVPLVRIRQWRALAYPALGRVVDNVPRMSRRGRPGWLPLVEFEAAGGSVRSPILATPTRAGWPLGQAFDVLYDPADPARVRPADAGMSIPWSLILGLTVVVGFLAVTST